MTTRDDFVLWRHMSPLLDAIGGFMQHSEDPVRFGFEVDEHKVNARGLLHAGAIAAIGDAAIGHTLAATTDPPTRLVTVNLACDLVGAARLGEWVEGTVSPTRVGRRLAAGSAAFRTHRAIAIVTALFVPVAEA